MQLLFPRSSGRGTRPSLWVGANSQHSCIGRGQSLQPNPSLKRTRTGMPFQALISFWAFHGLPVRAA